MQKVKQNDEKMLLLQDKIILEFQSMLPVASREAFISYWMSHQAASFRACCDWIKLHEKGAL